MFETPEIYENFEELTVIGTEGTLHRPVIQWPSTLLLVLTVALTLLTMTSR